MSSKNSNFAGLLRQPKWGHLRDLHKAIKLCEEAMVATDPNITSLGNNLEASIYKTESGLCAAFLANVDTQFDKTVHFLGNSYGLPAWSVSILPDCKNVVLNTAKINSLALVPRFLRQSVDDNIDSSKASKSEWSVFNEPVGVSKSNSFVHVGLLEQINTTADQSDYLWCSLSKEILGNEPFLQNGSRTLHVESLGHALYVYINGKLAGAKMGSSGNAKFKVEIPISLVKGNNAIDLLSLTVGLQNYGAYFDLVGAGVTGPVLLKDSVNGASFDLSSLEWTYQVGLKGEDLGLYDGSASEWKSQSTLPKQQHLTWYKTQFDAPSGSSPVALNLTGMGKGLAWVNGQSIGRYWTTNISPTSGCKSCSYKGSYYADKCRKNCGQPSQTLYHIPRSWMKSSENILVLFEEVGGDPMQISFTTREFESLCSHVSETYPLRIDTWNSENTIGGATSFLECPSDNQVISSIKFASFGTPSGTCGNFSHGSCNSSEALSIVQKACIGLRSCTIAVSIVTFGDPCIEETKSLAVEAFCSQTSYL